MKSIMHDKKDGTCYLCKMLHSDFSRKQTQEHHVMYGTANRRLSEQYGLKVYLCLKHHEEWGGPEAVHRNMAISDMLKAKAQEVFEKRFPQLDFRQIFGKNFLESTHRQQASKYAREDEIKGINFINSGVGEIDW